MPITGPDVLLYEKKNRIVTITLNRPERMNSLSLELLDRLAAAWVQFRDDEDAWVAVVTATGDKAFCTGFDLIDQAERDKKGETAPLILPRFYPHQIWKPIIAAINGYAVAGGWWLAQSCDIRISAEHAECGIGETRWNMPAYWVYGLPRRVSMGHALEIALWGDARISAKRGYEIGWINKVVPKEKLMDEAMSWAERMLYLAPRCVRNLKEIIYRSYDMHSSEAEAFSTTLETNLFGMEDKVEGVKAFAEKRKPNFKNK
jgi:enoyl-CoA hydratase/carnithine racemase